LAADSRRRGQDHGERIFWTAAGWFGDGSGGGDVTGFDARNRVAGCNWHGDRNDRFRVWSVWNGWSGVFFGRWVREFAARDQWIGWVGNEFAGRRRFGEFGWVRVEQLRYRTGRYARLVRDNWRAVGLYVLGECDAVCRGGSAEGRRLDHDPE
jgi:hypothetical protein